MCKPDDTGAINDRSDQTFFRLLRDGHVMEKQALTMTESLVSRRENYPDLRIRLKQHIDNRIREENLREEEAMAAWLADHGGERTRSFLQRDLAEVKAKR